MLHPQLNRSEEDSRDDCEGSVHCEQSKCQVEIVAVIVLTSMHALPTTTHVCGHCSMNTFVDYTVSEVKHCSNV